MTVMQKSSTKLLYGVLIGGLHYIHTDSHHLLHCDKYAFLVDLDLAVEF